jgi:hypothetical protein
MIYNEAVDLKTLTSAKPLHKKWNVFLSGSGGRRIKYCFTRQ